VVRKGMKYVCELTIRKGVMQRLQEENRKKKKRGGIEIMAKKESTTMTTGVADA